MMNPQLRTEPMGVLNNSLRNEIPNWTTDPDSVEEHGEVVLVGERVPGGEAVRGARVRRDDQLVVVKEARRQSEQRRVRPIILHQLRHLENTRAVLNDDTSTPCLNDAVLYLVLFISFIGTEC